jgi:hypothetical protein
LGKGIVQNTGNDYPGKKMGKSIDGLEDFLVSPYPNFVNSQGQKNRNRKGKEETPQIYLEGPQNRLDKSLVPQNIHIIKHTHPGTPKDTQACLKGLKGEGQPIQGEIRENNVPHDSREKYQVYFFVFKDLR